jgi:hypothetical protein
VATNLPLTKMVSPLKRPSSSIRFVLTAHMLLSLLDIGEKGMHVNVTRFVSKSEPGNLAVSACTRGARASSIDSSSVLGCSFRVPGGMCTFRFTMHPENRGEEGGLWVVDEGHPNLFGT